MRKLACLVLVLAPTLAAQRRAAPPAGWDAFVRAFDAYTRGDSIVGASVLVLKDGRVLARHEYGSGDRALGQRTDSNTIYHWASITKTLTAIAVMQLRDRGRLSLDDRVTQWIPELRQIHDPYGSVDSVTIRMLLSHASGFQNPTWLWSGGRPWEPFEPTRWEQLVAMMPYEEVAFPPGARFSYSNPGFIYLARVIEALSDDPWETYVQKNILTPLGLTRSYFGATPYHLAAYRSNNYTVVRDSAAARDSVVANGRDFDPGITIPTAAGTRRWAISRRTSRFSPARRAATPPWRAVTTPCSRIARSRRCGARVIRSSRTAAGNRPIRSGCRSSCCGAAAGASWATPGTRRGFARSSTSIRRPARASWRTSTRRATPMRESLRRDSPQSATRHWRCCSSFDFGG